eukprot:6001863-Amphidinium_carterae.1
MEPEDLGAFAPFDAYAADYAVKRVGSPFWSILREFCGIRRLLLIARGQGDLVGWLSAVMCTTSGVCRPCLP